VSDGGVFRNSSLCAAIQNNSLNLPLPEALDGHDQAVPLPYVIVADDAFPLSTNILKPYASRGLTQERRIFNYRLSRARRTVENAFGILANRFRVFMTPIALEPEKVEKVILASCALHNYLRNRCSSRQTYTPPGFVDTENETTHNVTPGDWRAECDLSNFLPFVQQGSNTYSKTSKDIRDEFCAYFNSASGAVSWQNAMI
jgi:hypothetical protein